MLFLQDFLDCNKTTLLNRKLCSNSNCHRNQSIVQTNRGGLFALDLNCWQEVDVFQVARPVMQSIVPEKRSESALEPYWKCYPALQNQIRKKNWYSLYLLVFSFQYLYTISSGFSSTKSHNTLRNKCLSLSTNFILVNM